MLQVARCLCFFFNDTATTEIYTLSLHDALPILCALQWGHGFNAVENVQVPGDAMIRERLQWGHGFNAVENTDPILLSADRKSTRLNSSHANISYAVFCLKKNNKLDSTHSNDDDI